jgi:hypothetical protein
LAVIPLMLDRVRLLEQTRLERIDEAANEALDLACRGADGQREIITAAKAILQVMARAYAGMIATGTTCNFYLADLAGGMPWMNGIAIIGADGRVKCSTNPAAVGVDMSDRPHIRTAMETREFVVSNYIVGRLNRKPTFAAVYPTQAIDANTQAAVLTSVDLQWVTALISSLQRRAGSSVLLIDGQGTIVAGDPGRPGPGSTSTRLPSSSCSVKTKRAPSAARASMASGASLASRACHRATLAWWSGSMKPRSCSVPIAKSWWPICSSGSSVCWCC